VGDARHLRRTFELASLHHTHPNPRVGAVVVDRSGSVIGEGAHLGAGHPHAEVVALGEAGARAAGSTLYVSLEPCSHHGLTPPCVEAIATAGVARVVVGAIDPDQRVFGSGVSRLRAEGIEVVTGLLEAEAEDVDPSYFRHRRTGLPRVTLKLAMTLDGSIAAADGSSQWITSEEARHDTHLLRSSMDAVVVGAGTLRLDDPILDVRLEEPVAHQPVPVIVAGRGDLPSESRVWERSPIVIATRELSIPTGDLVVVTEGREHPDPEEAARALADRGLLDLLLEGGARLAGSWWKTGVVGRCVFYVAGRVAGGRGIAPLEGEFTTMAQSRAVTVRDVRMVGPDVRVEFE